MARPLLILLLFLSSLNLSAQKTNSGTEFWLGFMGNFDSTYSGKKDSLRIYISASTNSKVVVRIPLKSYSASYFVPKDSVIAVSIPLHLGYINTTEVIEKKGIVVTSDFPVSLSAMNLLYATTDASIVLPISNIPRSPKYISGHPASTYNSNAFLLVANEDSTQIDITPISNTNGGKPAGVKFSILLNQGEVYQLLGSSMTGSIVQVTNNKKLVMFSGDKCSAYPCGACDHQYEQVMPEEVLDTSYLVSPHFGHRNGYYVRIVPIDTFTNIKVNGKLYSNVSRKKPLELNVNSEDTALYISGDKKFHCLQFMKGAGCNGYYNASYGDPSMVTCLSAKYFGERSLFSTVNSGNLRDHFVNIIIKTTSKNNVYLDNIKIDSSEFLLFQGAKKYSYAKIKLQLGQHMVECSDGHLAYCYGLGYYESYLYLAGFNLPNFDFEFKDSTLRLDCKNTKIYKHFKAKSDKNLKKVTWYFGDGQTAVGDPVNHTYTLLGDYIVKAVAEDFKGVKDSFSKKISINWPVFNPLTDKIGCGNDTVIFEERNIFFDNFKWSDGTTGKSFKSFTPGKIWVTATDTSGYCKFKDSSLFERISIFSNINIDSTRNCYRYNQFEFSDSVAIKSSSLLTKVWVIPNVGTYYDVEKLKVHFPMPGKYKVYFDIYTPSCKTRITNEVMIYPQAKVFSFPFNSTYCSGEEIRFYDSSQITVGKIEKVKWIFDDNSTAISDSGVLYKSLTYNPSNKNIARPFKHITISDHNCMDTAFNQTNIWPSPAADFTLSSDSISCLPTARWTFTNTTKIDSDTSDIFWDMGNGKKGTTPAMKNIRYFTEGEFKVQLIAKSKHSCSDTAIKFVEVIPVPKANFIINDSIQCDKSNSFVFRDSSVGNYLSYKWYFGDGKTSTIKDSVVKSYSTNGVFKVKLALSSKFAGCTDSITKTVYVGISPKANFSMNDSDQCSSYNEFYFYNKSIFSSPYGSTLWTWNSTNDTNYNSPSLSFSDTGKHSILLRVTDVAGCYDSIIKTFNVTSGPVMTLAVNDDIQCYKANNFKFKTATVKGESIKWFIDNKTQTSIVDSLNFTGNIAATYKVTVIKNAAGGCVDSISKTFKILAQPTVKYIADKDTQCLTGNSFSFKGNISAPGDSVISSEYFIDNLIPVSGPDRNAVKFNIPGYHSVTLKIKTKEGCENSDAGKILIHENPVVNIIGDSACLGDKVIIKATQISGNPINSFDWKMGDGKQSTGSPLSYYYGSAGGYNIDLKVTDIFGCDYSTTLNNGAVIYNIPDATFNYDINDDNLDTVKVNFKAGSANAFNKYSWVFPLGKSNGQDTQIIINDLFSGKVILMVSNVNGCADTTVKDIYIYPTGFSMFMPDVFTPNDDGLNDIFKTEGLKVASDFHFDIYNRWGEKLYTGNSPLNGWNGLYKDTKCPEGVYMYRISFKYLNGKTYNFTGTVTLLR
ncbi:MAG: gliding motility-associated C-terminal domain-containing protein [Bacteroidia bacterium]|nr:gliding motility-associated C-terminal domain-containing protein [Bacteroidia bacterium]